MRETSLVAARRAERAGPIATPSSELATMVGMRTPALFAAVLVPLGFTLACGGLGETAPDVASPQTWSGSGLSFDYPGNWSAEAETSAGFQSVTVESTGSTMVIVQIYEPGTDLSLDVFAPIFVTEMQKAMAEIAGGMIDLEPPKLTTSSRAIAGATRDARTGAFEVELFGIKVPHTIDMYMIDRSSGPILIYVQAPDEDRPTSLPGIDQVLDSMKI